jgi:ABC-type nitrate/sulfonate/bicarbonate transport system substrate-binding protein
MTVSCINKRALLLGGISLAGLLTIHRTARAQDTQFTEWGWRRPYEKISDKSVAWLKEKGWWPLQIAFQAPWSGQNNINIVMDKAGLLAQRGIEAKLQAFGSGPAINEVLVSAKFQVASSGNFPFTSLLDKEIPVKVIALITPNILHATIVSKDSKITSLKDFKGSNPPATIGIVTGSSAEFYFQMAATVHGLQIGKDVILKNMPIGEQMALPKGIDAVVPWDAGATMMVEERKNGKVIDTIYPYNMYEGNFVVRQELIDNVADVVQALSDAYVEALLWSRLYLGKTVQLLQDDPSLKNFTKDILTQQTRVYNSLYKPTFVYPHAKFWGEANAPIFKWLYQFKRIQRPLTASDFERSVDARFIDKTFDKLGWVVPKTPPFIPANWTGSLDKLPYPEYLTPVNLKAPQPFPEKGDLTKSWSFGGQTFNP